MEGLRDLLRELWAERGRVLFVTAGVVWGTVGLTFLLAFGRGFDVAMNAALDVTGPRLLVINGSATTMPHRGLPAGRPVRLTEDETRAVARLAPEVEAVSTEYHTSSVRLEADGVARNSRVLGVDPAYGDLRVFVPQPGGRFLDERDVRERRRTVFLGWRIKESLFGDTDAVGRTVKLRGQPFTVIGVMQPKLPLGNYAGLDEDKVCIPTSTFRAVFGAREVQYIVARLRDAGLDRAVIGSIFATLGPRLGFDPADRAALDVRNQPQQTREIRGILSGSRLFLAILGVLGLLVAVIGVTNATYVMVEERKREIGVQMAVGARPGTIARRHLAEGLVVVLAGGGLGLLVSAALLWAVDQVPMDARAKGYLGDPKVSWSVALSVAALLGVCGAAASWFPARRAAAVQPVEALRDE